MSVLRHAAYTEDESLLFVHAGVDPQRPLSEQGDSFWWGSAGFATMEGPFGRFQRVVRGYDRQHRGAQETPWTITLDAGCGFGGQLLAGCFAPGGALLDTLSA
jgi:serine/threonine protein phosphatase 1